MAKPPAIRQPLKRCRVNGTISVSEFFSQKPAPCSGLTARKALLTAVKEAVDNSLDACEEAGILPEISVEITQSGGKRFRMEVTDNGPGVMRQQMPDRFAQAVVWLQVPPVADVPRPAGHRDQCGGHQAQASWRREAAGFSQLPRAKPTSRGPLIPAKAPRRFSRMSSWTGCPPSRGAGPTGPRRFPKPVRTAPPRDD